MEKHAVVRHQDGRHWVAEVLPNKDEAEELAEIWRDRREEGVTYTVEPYAQVVTE